MDPSWPNLDDLTEHWNNMNVLNTLRDHLLATLTLIVMGAGLTSQAQNTDCALDFLLNSGCIDENLGWASATQVVNAVPPETITWSTGLQHTFVQDLPNGTNWVNVTDAVNCSVTRYFLVDCKKGGEDDKEEDKEDVCQFRTQTQGGWGAPPNGNNPGAYLHANFSSAFPSGLTIGCNRTLTLTTAQAVTNFLPSGTTPKMLASPALVNPGQTYKNVLAGQLVALTLSVGFDHYDSNFGLSTGNLADAIIGTGTFQGWTVQQLLDEANNFIGNCGSAYTAAQLNNALDMVNNNYVDGTADLGNLYCEKKGDEKGLTPQGSLRAYPNPAQDRLVLEVMSPEAGELRYMLLDAMGRTVLAPVSTSLGMGEQRQLTLDVSGLGNGTYLLHTQHRGHVMVERITVAH